VKTALLRTWTALRTVPALPYWALAALLLMLFVHVTGLLGLMTGFLKFEPVSGPIALRIVLITPFIPALAEETLFRGYLPNRAQTSRPRLWIAVSTAIFVAWHGVLTLILPGAGPIFLRPDFLATSACLGVVCATLRMRSGSIWPGVVVHWIVVAGWLMVLGGPSPGVLMGRP